MVNLETVLVLGAGASKDFGFPTGQQLVRQICEILSNRENWQFTLFHECADPQFSDEAKKFPRFLMQASPLSVDAWLEHNPKFIEVGKIAIAIALLQCEQKSNLIPENNWYQLLFHRLNSPFEEFQNNKLSIITFNYDRSLEMYLYEAFRFTHTEKSENECKEKINHFLIRHVYGSLGRLGWQTNDAEHKLPKVRYKYRGGKPNIKTVLSAANSIKIIPEKSLDLPEEFNEAQKLIADAQALYFMGFGYNEMNMQRLGIDTLRKPYKIMGTTLGLIYQRLREIERLGIPSFDRNQGMVNKPVYEFLYDCVDFNDGSKFRPSQFQSTYS